MLVSLAFVVAACGDDDDDSADHRRHRRPPPKRPTANRGTRRAGRHRSTRETEAPVETAIPVEPDGGTGETDYMWTPNDEVLAGAEGEVNLVAWAGYIEDGSTDPASTGSRRSRTSPAAPSTPSSATRATRWCS